MRLQGFLTALLALLCPSQKKAPSCEVDRPRMVLLLSAPTLCLVQCSAVPGVVLRCAVLRCAVLRCTIYTGVYIYIYADALIYTYLDTEQLLRAFAVLSGSSWLQMVPYFLNLNFFGEKLASWLTGTLCWTSCWRARERGEKRERGGCDGCSNAQLSEVNGPFSRAWLSWAARGRPGPSGGR